MSFHSGDIFAQLSDGTRYQLRLTLGALAEMSERLPAKGPRQLAAIMRAGEPEQMGVIVASCLRPVHGDIELPHDVARELFIHMPPLFERAFISAPKTLIAKASTAPKISGKNGQLS